MNHHASVHAALRGLKAPERLTGAHVYAHDIAVACAGVKHAAAVHIGEDWRGERAVLRGHTRCARPDRGAGGFVERIKTIAGRALFAPVTGHAADDHQIPVNHRRAGAAVREGEPTETFHQRVFPLHLAVRAEAFHAAVGGHQVHPTGGRIDCGRADGVPAIHCVAEIIIISVLPLKFAVRLIQAEQHFLQIRPLAAVAPGIHVAIGDHRRAAAGNVVAPEKVLGRINLIRQSLLIRHAVLVRTAPVGPAAHRSLRGKRRQGKKTQRREGGKFIQLHDVQQVLRSRTIFRLENVALFTGPRNDWLY